MALLDRDTFRPAVFKRDGERCVVCGRGISAGVRLDAHHVMERRLFTAPHEFGGYFLDNGATLCDDGTAQSCHMKAEMTTLSCEDIRAAVGIKRVVLPEHLYPDTRWTKWGDPILPNGKRMRGELFFDESVQRVLALGGVLPLYTHYVKYPRTFHLPWSGKVLANDLGDDRVLDDRGLENLRGSRVVVTVKLDGQNATMYRDYMHARTTDFKSDLTWHWLQAFHASIAHEIPDRWRICCENLHKRVAVNANAIHYRGLSQFVQAFSVWNDRNLCLSWDETVEWMQLLDGIAQEAGYARGFPIVPVLYDGVWDSDFENVVVPTLSRPHFHGDPMEGYVVRLAAEFPYSQFRRSVAKFVRAGHQAQHGKGHAGSVITNELTASRR
jgi:hypothetical protein